MAVHLYVQGSARLKLGGQEVILRQETGYPWDGAVDARRRDGAAGELCAAPAAARLVPERDACASTGRPSRPQAGAVTGGYCALERAWQTGDTVQLDLAMPVERVYAHPAVRQDAGRVALQRGPLVYCLEEVDNTAPPHRIALPRTRSLVANLDADLLGGLTTIGGPAVIEVAADGVPLYGDDPPALQPGRLTAVPYYAWANRRQGQMAVWIREVAEGAGG